MKITQSDKFDDEESCVEVNSKLIKHQGIITSTENRDDLTTKYLSLKQAESKCLWVLEYQRKTLLGYKDLVEKHAELKRELHLINSEKEMWRVDLEREKWTHEKTIGIIMKRGHITL